MNLISEIVVYFKIFVKWGFVVGKFKMEKLIAKNLIKLLKLNNLTQKQLADKIKVKQQIVNRWVNNKALPTTKNLDKLAEFFSVPVSYFYNENQNNNSGIINNGNNNNNSINSNNNQRLEFLEEKIKRLELEIELLKRKK